MTKSILVTEGKNWRQENHVGVGLSLLIDSFFCHQHEKCHQLQAVSNFDHTYFSDCERGIIFKELVSTETKVIAAAFQQVVPELPPEVGEVGNGGHINSMHQPHCN